MSYLDNAITTLEQVGVFNVLLPFLLVFTVIYAILQKTKILGKDKRNFNIAVSLVIAMLVVVEGHIVMIMNKAIPNVGIVIIAIVMMLILIGVLGGEVSWLGGSLSGWIALIAFVAIVYIFGDAAGWWTYGWPGWLGFMNNPATQSTVVVLLIFGVLIWFITREEDDTKGEKMMDKLGDMFKPGK